MIKRALTIFAMCLLMCGAATADDLRALFIDMPDSIMPALTRSDRMDFIDYMESNMKARVANKLGGESLMTAYSDRSLTVMTSRSGRMDVVLFPCKKGGNLICIIKTVTARYNDSRLSFYDESWNPVDAASLIEQPHFDDYLTKEAIKADSIDYFRKLSMLRLQEIVPVDGGLEFRYTSLEDVGEDASRFGSWFKPEPLRYKWNGKRFKRK